MFPSSRYPDLVASDFSPSVFSNSFESLQPEMRGCHSNIFRSGYGVGTDGSGEYTKLYKPGTLSLQSNSHNIYCRNNALSGLISVNLLLSWSP